jgi:hypothetical protein
MRSRPVIFFAFIFSFALSVPVLAQQTVNADTWSAVETALGRAGSIQPGDVFKFSFPRSDLTVKVGNVIIKPALALGSWVAFRKAATGDVMVMGDLVLTENEVDPVMQALQTAGIEQSALHNHLLGETPRIKYMHISAHGNAVQIAEGIRSALAKSGTPLSAAASATASAADLDTAGIKAALGVSGKLNGVVYQVSVARADRISAMGMEVPPSMGVATAINFQPTGSGKAAITGDFVMIGSEVNPVIRALKQNGIAVTALHSHMLDEEPRLFFMHFWAIDDAVKLSRGLRAALDKMAVKLN